MNTQNDDFIRRKEVLELINSQMYSLKIDSPEFQRLYSLQLSVEKLKTVSKEKSDHAVLSNFVEQTADLRTTEQTPEEMKACALRVFQSLDRHTCYIRPGIADNVYSVQAVEVYELLSALQPVLPKEIHRSLSRNILDEYEINEYIGEQEAASILSDMDILNESMQKEEFEQER